MPTNHLLRADLADPFAQDKRNELIRQALADPLNVLLPASEDAEEEEDGIWEKKKDIMRRETKLNDRDKGEISKPSKFPVMR